MKKVRKTAVVCGRLSNSLAQRLDWIVRNHGEVSNRAEALETAVKDWIEAREKECIAAGLAPPT